MSRLSAHHAYLDLTDKLFNKHLSERDLPEAAAQLPPFTETILQKLVAHTERIGLSEPERSSVIMEVVSKIVGFQRCGLRIRSEVDWHLGFAYNRWAQPQKAATVIMRARRGFIKLNDRGWIAACGWQLNALPWTKSDFAQAVRSLKRALNGLEQAGFDQFTPYCRLTLAYAQILINEFNDAKENIDTCELMFVAQGDDVNQAHCWMDRASLFRRQNQFSQAFESLEKALKVFRKKRLPISIAKTYHRLALCYFLSTADYKKAEHYFEKASRIFNVHNLELFYGNCLNGLGQINIINGNLSKASDLLEEERTLLIKYGIPGLTADNYNDGGQLELLKGNAEKSIVYFKNAELLYRQIKMGLSATIALANQGDAYAIIGRFQDALYYLELARKRFQEFDDPSRLAGCEIYLSRIWTDLNRYETAHKHLDQAEKLLVPIGQQILLAWVYNQRAKIFSLEGKQNQAVESLEKALVISKKCGTTPQIALVERQLGEVLSLSGKTTEALQFLRSAEIEFIRMGMNIERAATLTSLGYYYLQEYATQKAGNAFKKALGISRTTMPDIESRAYTGLAILADGQDNQEAALASYRKAIRASLKLRDSFWQPALAGSYLTRSAHPIGNAVSLAVRLEAHYDALAFIESSKAQSLVKQIISAPSYRIRGVPTELDNLRAEIQTLQRQLRVTFDAGSIFQFSKIKEIQQRLVVCAREYDEKLGQIERQDMAESIASADRSPFNLEKFRAFANDLFDAPWVALDYYLTDSRLSGVMLSSEDCVAWETSISTRERSALQACAITYRGMPPPSMNERKLLGNLLFPAQLQKHLLPNAYLIIAPHQALHAVPWVALQSENFNGYLVENSIPLVIPSLEILQLTRQRSERIDKPDRKTGILLGLADFKETRRALPLVRTEIKAICQKANPDSVTLVNSQATWNALNMLCAEKPANDKGLARFSFFHIASHIIQDAKTGRLTNIALYDDEIWLDQLRDLAPLPDLITLSACNGTQSLIYTEDEHVSLATTCLIAGARVVIGSLWPVLDKVATNLMIGFYENYFSGSPPPKALAQVQRKVLDTGEDLQNWASFNCMGML